MRCNKATGYLSQGMDEQLPPDVTVELTRHLDGCESCQAYREDLLVARRLITATEPEISENFEWKLQLRLNQAMQQAVGESAYPWESDEADRWHWFRNFGAATAVGLAAVLALAMFIGPVGGPQAPGFVAPGNLAQNTPSLVRSASSGAVGSDRLPFRLDNPRGGLQRSVSTGANAVFTGGERFSLNRGWSGGNTSDLMTIQRLKAQNQQLNHRMRLLQQEVLRLRAKLDSSDSSALDLEQK